jgi:hypothetical protein
VTGQILIYFWFVTLGLIVLCFSLRYIQRPVFQSPSTQWLQVVPFLLTLLIIICGGAFRGDYSTKIFYPWATNVVFGLILLQLLISGITFWQTQRWRRFIVALAALQLWLSLASGFVSLMSIQDSWI